MKISLHAYVSGLVQGVFYRQSTRNKAIELGLTGWVRNLADGRVEVFASGDAIQIHAFEKWLWSGPAAAQVAEVVVAEKPWQKFHVFEIIK